jgi:hypothetical protein
MQGLLKGKGGLTRFRPIAASYIGGVVKFNRSGKKFNPCSDFLDEKSRIMEQKNSSEL